MFNKKWSLIGLSLLLVIGFVMHYGKQGGGNQQRESREIRFATSADYPPFEYFDQNKIVGFDIDIGEEIARRLGKKAVFINMAFSTIPAALSHGIADAGLSSLSATAERRKNFVFTSPYHVAKLTMVTRTGRSLQDLGHEPIATQLGSTMELWMKAHMPSSPLVLMDDMNLAIEALRSGKASGAVMDDQRARDFLRRNPDYVMHVIGQGDGAAVMLPLDSPWKDKIEIILKEMGQDGTLERLEKKWMFPGT